MSDEIYDGPMPFIEERGNQVVFGGGGNPDGLSVNGRPLEGSEFVIDRWYWEALGKPDKIVVGFSTEEGWEKKFYGNTVDSR